MTPTVLEPADAMTTAAMLAQASVDRRPVLTRGGGTKLAWGATAGPGAPETVLSTRRMSAPIQHYAGDLVATLPAGATLAEANAVLAGARQWLPLDPPGGAHATIGGIVATNDSGPRRHQHGSARDLIIGIEFALADGRIAKAGGRVVKNVAGYDLSRLLCGSFGSLAVITSATFKLAPLAPASRTVRVPCDDVRSAQAIALAVAAAPLSPSALEIATPAPRLLIRFETTEKAAARQAAAAAAIAETAGGAPEILSGAAEAIAWRDHERALWSGPGTIVKFSVLPTQVGDTLAALAQSASERHVNVTACGRAALGVFFTRLEGRIEAQADAVAAIRRLCPSATMLDAPDGVRAIVPVWGEIGSALPIMRAVKQRFDPHNILNPGRGPGGI